MFRREERFFGGFGDISRVFVGVGFRETVCYSLFYEGCSGFCFYI